ncbi:hypothetical protein Z043_126181, partial [Scleropages formosus]
SGASALGPHGEDDWAAQDEESVEQCLLEHDAQDVTKEPGELSSKVLLIYIAHVALRSLMEVFFLAGQYYLFGFRVPYLFRCEVAPCPTRTDCFVSRATEKTVFLNFMFAIGLGCVALNVAELHYLGWLCVLRTLWGACSACCVPRRGSPGGADRRPLLLRLEHSMRSRVVLHARAPALSFQTDSTVECMSNRGPESSAPLPTPLLTPMRHCDITADLRPKKKKITAF